jgi:hypothetical protein
MTAIAMMRLPDESIHVFVIDHLIVVVDVCGHIDYKYRHFYFRINWYRFLIFQAGLKKCGVKFVIQYQPGKFYWFFESYATVAGKALFQ